MDILFIGGTFSKEVEKEILSKSKSVVHYAANKLQWNIIDGFSNMPDVNLRILSAPFVGTYPKEYKDIKIREFKAYYKESIECKYVAFCNIWGYRSISRKNALIKEMEDFINLKSLNKVIMVYSPHTPFLQAAVYAKRKDPSIHINLVVPDLPQYMNLSENISLVYKKLKELDIKVLEKNLKYVNSFVLLTEHMKDIIKVSNRPYTVIEGMVRTPQREQIRKIVREPLPDTIVYTGTLNKKFGALNLVEAFTKINNPNVVLKLCGRGDLESVLNEYALKDERIHLLGQLSNEDALKLQQKATLLVNPRQDNEEYTKYSFPSKNMEYLLSGTPVIAYKLKGIPNEYDNYLNYVEDNTISSLKSKIEELLYKDAEERSVLGQKARSFVVDEKNNNQQSLKILNMIKNKLE